MLFAKERFLFVEKSFFYEECYIVVAERRRRPVERRIESARH